MTQPAITNPTPTAWARSTITKMVALGISPMAIDVARRNLGHVFPGNDSGGHSVRVRELRGRLVYELGS